jgi:TRAP transporter TAXI family solute receptor
MNRIAVFAAAVTLMSGIGLAATMNTSSALDSRLITIGTGSVTGVYYPAGGAVCRQINRERWDSHIRCAVEATDGSLYNLNALRRGNLDFAVAQSDWQYHAYKGSARFQEEEPFHELRSVFGLHNEPFTVLARADAHIDKFEELRGKRVNIGNPGSGQRATMDVVLRAYGWTTDNFAAVSELPVNEQAEALCGNRVDAVVFTIGHPNGSIEDAAAACPTRLVRVAGEPIDKLVQENPFYAKAVIPGGLYEGNPDDIESFGVRATLVTTTRTAPDLVHTMVRDVFEHFDEFKRLHPAFQTLDKMDMIQNGLSAPLHDGAKQYLREAGLM